MALHQDVGRAVAPAGLEAVRKATVGQGLEAVEGQRGAEDVAA